MSPPLRIQVTHYERDAAKIAAAGGKQIEGIYYQTLTGIKDQKPISHVQLPPMEQEAEPGAGAGGEGADGVKGEEGDAAAAADEEEEEEDSEEEEVRIPMCGGRAKLSVSYEVANVRLARPQEEEEEDDVHWKDKPKLSVEEAKEAKKLHKAALKEANADKRTTKIPKHLKKRNVKATSGKKK
jgi:RIO kinase 1